MWLSKGNTRCRAGCQHLKERIDTPGTNRRHRSFQSFPHRALDGGQQMVAMPVRANSCVSRSIAAVPPSSASRASTIRFTCDACCTSHVGRAAVPTSAITEVAGMPAASNASRSKPPSTRMSVSARRAGSAKPNQPAGLVLIQRRGMPGCSSTTLCAFSSIPGCQPTSVRPMKPQPSGACNGNSRRPIQRRSLACCSAASEALACSHTARDRYPMPLPCASATGMPRSSRYACTRRDVSRDERSKGASVVSAARSSCCHVGGTDRERERP